MTDKRTPVVKADEAGMARAIEVLANGGLVAVPTETVYGLAARGDRADTVARIYAAKGRPSFNPLIVHVAGVTQAKRFAVFTPEATALATRYWPGPLTLVLPRQAHTDLAPAITAGLPSVALRVPSHPVMQTLLGRCAFPLAAPSANRSGFISPTRADHVLASLDGRIDLVLDDGPTAAGVESTILVVRAQGGVEELRPGPITIDAALRQHDVSRIEAPGQLASHYAPGKPMRLDAERAAAEEFMIGFGAITGDVSLSLEGNLAQAAARLYDCLHAAATAEQARIAVAAIPRQGIGRAINDRLERAAAPLL